MQATFGRAVLVLAMQATLVERSQLSFIYPFTPPPAPPLKGWGDQGKCRNYPTPSPAPSCVPLVASVTPLGCRAKGWGEAERGPSI